MNTPSPNAAKMLHAITMEISVMSIQKSCRRLAPAAMRSDISRWRIRNSCNCVFMKPMKAASRMSEPMR